MTRAELAAEDPESELAILESESDDDNPLARLIMNQCEVVQVDEAAQRKARIKSMLLDEREIGSSGTYFVPTKYK